MKHEEMIAVITAHKEGKQIQYRVKYSPRMDEPWKDCKPNCNLELEWDFAEFDYMVKPEPKYRPYKDADECFADVKKHGGWVKIINCAAYYYVRAIYQDGIDMLSKWSYREFLRDCTWADDGTPCGVKEE